VPQGTVEVEGALTFSPLEKAPGVMVVIPPNLSKMVCSAHVVTYPITRNVWPASRPEKILSLIDSMRLYEEGTKAISTVLKPSVSTLMQVPSH
jgi:hypothetical protein